MKTIETQTAETFLTATMKRALDAQTTVRARLAEEIAEQVKTGAPGDLVSTMRTVIHKDAEADPWHHVASYQNDGQTLIEAVRRTHDMITQALLRFGISVTSQHIANEAAIAKHDGMRRFVSDVAPLLRALDAE
ncbi:hypothetical protein AB0395_34925 [Streptosporangium sp. NPDC051023]|uniref:hypothetical protein n=1 Tax=Streptosporangium sp. NPDC051023 TaxID=3155410 RepID=UPI00344E47FD